MVSGSSHLSTIFRWGITVVNHGLDEALAKLGAVGVYVCSHSARICSNCLDATRSQPAEKYNNRKMNKKYKKIINLSIIFDSTFMKHPPT